MDENMEPSSVSPKADAPNRGWSPTGCRSLATHRRDNVDFHPNAGEL